MEEGDVSYPYQPGFFDEFGDWLDGAQWRANLFGACVAALVLVVIYGVFAVTIYCGYWLGLGMAWVVQSREAFEQGIPLLTGADHFAHLLITLPIWCVLTYHQVVNHPNLERLEGGMLVERRDWPNHSLWFYLIFVFLFPAIAGFVSAVW